jgi:hypothetical protein
MSRRKIRNWVVEAVEPCTVAPYRYGEDFDGDFRWDRRDYKAYREAVPYKEGDVIWVEGFDYPKDGDYRGVPAPKRGRVVDSIYEIQRDGDRLELYYVQYETKAGIWAKVATKVYPGYVERGYKQAAQLGKIVL